MGGSSHQLINRQRVSFYCLLCVLAFACVRNPATGRRQLNLVSRDKEIAMGQQSAQDVANSIGIYDDAALQRYVERIGRSLVQVSERKDLPWEFHVVDDASVNAFALPGGFIYVTRGLLAHMENEAQLATVMGHEVGHVTAQHSANQVSKAELAQAGLAVVGVGGALVGMRGIGALSTEGVELLFLKFSRDDERQADDLGLRYALRAGYDVREMPKVFSMLGRVSESEGGGKLPNWLETHPAPEERVERSEQKIARLHENLGDMKRDQPDLMQAIDGLVYGQNPREGFFRGERFYHPELAFSFALPPEFKGNNTKAAVIAGSQENDAAMELTLAPDLPKARALQEFLDQAGIEPRSDPHAVGPGLGATFTAETQQGMIAGLVSFVEHHGKTFQFVGITEPARFGQYEREFESSFASFQEVTDPAVLERGPERLKVKRLAQPTKLTEVAKAHQDLPLDQLAILNQVNEQAELPSGSYLKWVEPAKQ